jgi:hypothetical protein
LLVTYRISDAIIHVNIHLKEHDWDFDHGPLVLRHEPLYLLKKLCILAMPQVEKAPILGPVLGSCPAADSAALPKPFLC